MAGWQRAAARAEPDLVLRDADLYGDEEREIVRRIRGQWPRACLVLLTDDARKLRADQASQAQTCAGSLGNRRIPVVRPSCSAGIMVASGIETGQLPRQRSSCGLAGERREQAMSVFLRWLLWGTVILTMGWGLPTRVAAQGHAAVGASPTMLKECYPEGLYLYETEAPGSDGCGVRVDRRGAWQREPVTDGHAEPGGSSTALSSDPGSGREQEASGAPDWAAAETSADGGGLVGAAERRLLVDQAAQVMRVYEDGAETRTLPVSTGMLTSKTFTRAWRGTVGRDMGPALVDGGMRVQQAWHLFPDVFGNILIHSVPYVQQGAVRLYDQPEALGVRPSSHGCIRVSEEDAEWLRAWGPVGVPIEITGPPGPVQHVG